jgi:hypothetical protein
LLEPVFVIAERMPGSGGQALQRVPLRGSHRSVSAVALAPLQDDVLTKFSSQGRVAFLKNVLIFRTFVSTASGAPRDAGVRMPGV